MLSNIKNTYYWFLLARYRQKMRSKPLSGIGRVTEEDFKSGWSLYNHTDALSVKSKRQVIKECNRLYKYWHCFPDVYFRLGMFLKNCTDWNWMISFVPQVAFARYEQGWKHREYGILLDDKIIFNELLSSYGVPVPEVLFCFKNNRFFVKGKQVQDKEVDSLLSHETTPRIFAKVATGSCANGISVFSKGQNGYTANGGSTVINAQYIRKLCGNDNYHFEKQLEQDYSLAKFCSDTINTIRIVTLNNENTHGAIIVGASVRFGRKGGFVDNLAQGGIAVKVDVKNGELCEYGMREYDISKYFEHPDTHLMFTHSKIAHWDKVLLMVQSVSAMLPQYRVIGWDIALTPSGPVLIEMNTGTGIYSVQMNFESGVAEAFQECIPHYTK